MTRSHSAASVRSDFLAFFRERDHRIVPSSPVFPQDDPTLLFTNAGMNQFKDVFLGTGTRAYARAADTQKCIRVSGKHNDLEEVGRDTYHHTFFEMLGNWSFGDYFKAEAIAWAWELLTGVWALPKERLWVTVFGGDEADGLPADEEAERLWRETTDVDPAHVLRFGKGDNFWEMGDTGPCGPCSEIHLDRGGDGADPRDGADPAIGVNAGNERFIELWNLVFMEFNRLDDRSLKPLPAKHVDTGMGFERVTSVLQGERSNYDTDLFTPIFARLEELCGKRYDEGGETAVAFRVCADHVRAVTAAFADGALPSNLGRGYVLRRLLRRAARFGRQTLGVEDPFLFDLVPVVAEVLGGTFPEMRERIDHVRLLVREEEAAFGRTLGRGIVRFEDLARRVGDGGERILGGAAAYELYATYGFPRDLVELMARERGLDVDAAGWREAEERHREASRSEGRFRQLLSGEELEGLPPTESTYHGSPEEAGAVTTRLVRHFPAAEEGGGERLVLERSPFYPEAGGQIGDRGSIEAVDGTFRFEVLDTRKIGSIVVHLGASEGIASDRGTEVVARVDEAARDRTRKNHTATHLLHEALKRVLGAHVTQQGSYVGPDRLRFDFSHPKAMSPEEIEEVERVVNARVVANAPVETTVEDLEAAKARGVVALFGEKYDDRVRVVDVGGWSTELCGGTHVRAAGDVGPFAIVGEGAIQAGVRRIEAITGPAAVAWMQEQRRLLRGAAQRLKVAPDELAARIVALQTQVKEARKRKQASSAQDVDAAFGRWKEAAAERAGVHAGVVDLPELGLDALRELASRVKGHAPDVVGVLFGREGERVPFLVVAQGAALERGLRAGELAKRIGGVLGGGGGGRPELAQGQGTNAGAVEDARSEVERAIAESLAG